MVLVQPLMSPSFSCPFFLPHFFSDCEEIVIISSYWAHVGCKPYHKKWNLLLAEYYKGPWALIAHSALSKVYLYPCVMYSVHV